MSANDRLERLLYVLPRAARKEGARIDDLARALGVRAEDILADIEEATARVFYHPGGHVDAFDLAVDDGVVRLFGNAFNRPLRLTAEETMALGLGLRVLAAEADAQRRAEILELAMRLEQDLATPEVALQPMVVQSTPASLRERGVYEPAEPIEVALGQDDYRGDIAEAIEKRSYCDVMYLKADGTTPTERRVAPVRLVFTHGHWYMRAVEPQSGQHRMYRLDRILDLRVTAQTHEYADVPAGAPAFTTDGGQPVRVRYSPAVARWVAERSDAQCEPDGSLVLVHDVVDMNWLVRHVLQYGGEAVVETEDARAAVAAAASQTLRP